MRLFRVDVIMAACTSKHGEEATTRERQTVPDRDANRLAKRDAVSARAAERLLPGRCVPADARGAAAWKRVVDQHRSSPRMLTQTEIARRWRGEVAMDALESETARDLLMLGRDEVADGAPSDHEIESLLQTRVARAQTVDSWDHAGLFWDLCSGRLSRERAITHGGEHTRALAAYGRFETLQSALTERGVELRPDSRLCAQFVDDSWSMTLGMPLDNVVDTMEEMAWLFRTDPDVHYQARRDDFFHDEMRTAREFGDWLSPEEMHDVGDVASINAKESIARKLVRDHALCAKLEPIPRQMKQRMAAFAYDLEAERRAKEARAKAVEETFRA